MPLEWKNLNETTSFQELTQSNVNPQTDINAQSVVGRKIPVGGSLDFYFGTSLVDDKSLTILQKLSDEQQLTEKYRVLLNGETINTGENRKVLHHLTRAQLGSDVIENSINLRDFYKEQQNRIVEFAKKIHSGEIGGSTGKKFDTVVQIGIGGSDLGPRALYLALRNAYPVKLRAFFISNVDPDDAADVIAGIDPETSLFVLVSKSGTTQETLANRDIVLDRMKSAGIDNYNPSKHLVAVTSKTSPLAGSSDVLDSFYIDDYIGGRYSSTSAVGGVVLSLAFGAAVFTDILAGAAEADKLALNENLNENASLLDALIGVYYRNIMKYPSSAVLPYSQALSRFPAHLQQLDMESNGKSVNRRGERLSYSTGPVIFGEPGTNGQHSFFQLLHQGTDIVPLQFIAFRDSQTGQDKTTDGSTSQTKLNANLAAQIIAFAKGSKNKDMNKNFEGNRPSTLIVGPRLNARALGALLGHFENKVMFQGFCWNLNSFDQEGVQLGKVLTKTVLEGNSNDEALKAYADILGVR